MFSYNAEAWKFDSRVPSWSIRFSSWLIGRLHIGVYLLTPYQIHILQYFLPSCSLSFTPFLCFTLFIHFTLCPLLHRGFKINIISFVYFYLVTNTCALGIISKKSLLIQCFTLVVFFLRVLSSLTFRSLIHSELIFLHDVRSSLFCIWIFCFPSTIHYRD